MGARRLIPKRSMGGERGTYEVHLRELQHERCIGSVSSYKGHWVARVPGVETREQAMRLLEILHDARNGGNGAHGTSNVQ